MKKKAYRKKLAKEGTQRKERTFEEWCKVHGLKRVKSDEEIKVERCRRSLLRRFKHFVLRPIAKWLYLSK